MTGGNPWRVGALEFVQMAVQERAATYRQRAACLTEMAASEPTGRFRKELLELAGEFGELAASLECEEAPG